MYIYVYTLYDALYFFLNEARCKEYAIAYIIKCIYRHIHHIYIYDICVCMYVYRVAYRTKF